MYTVKQAFQGPKRVVKKSRFIAIIYPVKAEDQISNILTEQRKIYKKASHLAWASRIYHKNKILIDFSDDGEVKGTAGEPISNILKAKQMINVFVMVIRYYGGIKLGPSGLIREYAKSAQELLENIPLEEIKFL